MARFALERDSKRQEETVQGNRTDYSYKRHVSQPGEAYNVETDDAICGRVSQTELHSSSNEVMCALYPCLYPTKSKAVNEDDRQRP
jgi:hypothetical protein